MKHRVLIIGGGIAGLEAAGQLEKLGCHSIVVEREMTVGGHVCRWNRLFPDMSPAEAVMKSVLDRTGGAEILTGTSIRSLNRLKDAYSAALSDGRTIVADAVLFATGFSLFDAHKKEEYGYGVYNNVITSADLESWFETGDDPRIPVNVNHIGFVHCVGSRDVKAGNSQCSKVCCMTAVKQAIEMKEKYPFAEIWCFYMDLRLFGKKYEDFYINAQRDYGIHFIRGRVSEVSENIDGHLLVKAEDTLNGKPLKITLDLLVLMAGIVSDQQTEELSRMLRLETDTDGFLRSSDNICNIISSQRPGIFFAGACTGAKTIGESVAEARSAALAIHSYLQEK